MSGKPDYFEHVTATGERWDLIAHQYYGDAKRIAPLLMANAHIVGDTDVATPLVLDRGIKLIIPILPDDEVIATQLPPWKRK